MGNGSSIAFGIAINKPNWFIGDGFTHISTMIPENMAHIIINNGVHETVGGMPIVAEKCSSDMYMFVTGLSSVFRGKVKE